MKNCPCARKDLSQKQFKIVSDIERTLLELKLELMREDRFTTEGDLQVLAGQNGHGLANVGRIDISRAIDSNRPDQPVSYRTRSQSAPPAG